MWSHDGRHLFFMSDRGGTANLWRVAIDERSGEVMDEPESVTSGILRLGHATISADGDKIAYEAWDQSGDVMVYDFDPDAEEIVGEPKRLLSTSHLLMQFDVSPDNQWLVYRRSFPTEDVVAVRMDGTGRRVLTRDHWRDRGPKFTPDGERVMFYSNRSGPYRLWAVELDGTGLTQLAKDVELGFSTPVWDPDGDQIAAYSLTEEKTIILTFQADGSTGMSELPAVGDGDFFPRSWSNDGKRLAGTASTSLHNGQAYVYEIAAETYTALEYEDGRPVIGDPYWLPDARRVLIGDVGEGQIILVDTETGRTRVIFEGIVSSGQITIVSPDGTKIVAGHFKNSSNIWLLDMVDAE